MASSTVHVLLATNSLILFLNCATNTSCCRSTISKRHIGVLLNLWLRSIVINNGLWSDRVADRWVWVWDGVDPSKLRLHTSFITPPTVSKNSSSLVSSGKKRGSKTAGAYTDTKATFFPYMDVHKLCDLMSLY